MKRERASLDDELIGLFEAQGRLRVDTPILQPAELFLDLSGEDIRRRLYLTQDGDGRELCLRPEYTIPVCRQHIQAGAAAAEYCYLGPVFRLRGDDTGEFLQAGFESIGRDDTAPADADSIGTALEGIRVYTAGPLDTIVGDMGLTTALFDALAITAGVRRRLGRALAAGRGVAPVLQPAAEPSRADYAGLLAAIEGQDPTAARAFVEDVISIAGISRVGGRSAGEIAERFLLRAENRSGTLPDRTREVLGRYFDIRGDLDMASEAVGALAGEFGLDLGGALGRFVDRTGFMAARGVDVGSLRFAADFARNLDYYTGFVFEIRDPRRAAGHVLAAGGRYDGLLQHLGAPAPVPGVGCSFWLDRLQAGRPEADTSQADTLREGGR